MLIVIFLASYLADKREMLAAGSGRFSLPRAKDLGPLLIAWATSLAVLFLEKDLGASLLYFARLRRDALDRERPPDVPARRAGAVRRAARGSGTWRSTTCSSAWTTG